MNIPKELIYTKEHEWLKVDGDIATVGVTDHAQEQLGDVVYVELPEIGESFDTGEAMGVVESTKAASDVFMPIKGEISEVNEDLPDQPESVNNDPYGEGWLVKIKIDDKSELDELLKPEDYEKYLSESDD